MVFRHSLIYAAARGGPAAVNFVALLLFARLLAPAEYGRYGLVVAGVGVANATLFWWLQFGLTRFLPSYRERRSTLLSVIAAGYAATVAATLPILALLLLAPVAPIQGRLVVLGCILLWTQSWHDLNLELTRSDLAPTRYGLLLSARSLLLLCVGGGLALAGWGAVGVLLGAIAGSLIPSLVVLRRHWGGVHPASVQGETVRRILTYALPLTATSAMMLIVGMSGRFFLEWFSDPHALGVYSAGSDLAQFTLGTVMNVVYLAAFPLALRSLEAEGADVARGHLSRGWTAMLAVGAPGVVGLWLLSEPVAHYLLGADFSRAGRVIPWIALATFLAGLKGFYFDLSFQIGHATRIQLAVALGTLAMNLGLTALWTPQHGAAGAAAAAALSFGTGLLLSAWFGRGVFALPFPVRETVGVLLATALMGAALALAGPAASAAGLAARVVGGAAVYALGVLTLNVMGTRRLLFNVLRPAAQG